MEIDGIALKNALIDWLLDIDDHEILPDGICALNFGIYQGGYDGQISFKQALAEHPYEIEVTGSKRYNAEDDNWVCNEDFVPRARSCPHFAISEDIDRDTVFHAVARALVDVTDELDVISILDVPYITMGFTDEPLAIIRSDENRIQRPKLKKITDIKLGNNIKAEYEYPIAYRNPEDEAMSAFLQKNIAFYKYKWSKHENKQLRGWNWAAFFFPIEWLVYRKMYAEAASILFVSVVIQYLTHIPFRLLDLVIALVGNALYYKKYMRMLKKTNDMTHDSGIEYLNQKGGVSAISLAICIVMELVIGVIMIVL